MSADDVFKLFDKDGDGRVNAKELANIMRSIGAYPTNKELTVWMKEKGKDGTMDLPSFNAVLADKQGGKEALTKDKILRAFSVSISVSLSSSFDSFYVYTRTLLTLFLFTTSTTTTSTTTTTTLTGVRRGRQRQGERTGDSARDVRVVREDDGGGGGRADSDGRRGRRRQPRLQGAGE
jgi:hypothetical protein